MKHEAQADLFQNAFRTNGNAAIALSGLIEKDASLLWNRHEQPVKIMTFCGTHEWTVTRYGLRSLLPASVELVPGPGCPVCVTPSSQVEQLVNLAMEGLIVYSYGDGFRLPIARQRKGDARSLQDARAKGADVRVVYSFLDAVRDAKTHGKKAVFFGMGFETITPSYSMLFREGLVPQNLSFLSAVKLTPPAMKHMIKVYADKGLLPLDGIIAPGHVSAVLGAKVWDFLPKEHGLPTVVSGFEPLDVLYSVAEILRMLRNSTPALFNEYQRLVTWNGNIEAKAANSKVMEEVTAGWRGIGPIPLSGYGLKEELGKVFDVAKNLGLDASLQEDSQYEMELPPGCRCGDVIIGAAKPNECPMFMKGCTPENAWGPCMVSAEGTCRVWAMHSGVATVGPLLASEKGE